AEQSSQSTGDATSARQLRSRRPQSPIRSAPAAPRVPTNTRFTTAIQPNANRRQHVAPTAPTAPVGRAVPDTITLARYHSSLPQGYGLDVTHRYRSACACLV